MGPLKNSSRSGADISPDFLRDTKARAGDKYEGKINPVNTGRPQGEAHINIDDCATV